MLNASIVSFFVDKIQSLSPTLVYIVVALLVFGEAAIFLGFIFPGETSVIVAGVVASQGRVNIGALIVLVIVAAILGDTTGYYVGNRWGTRILRMKFFDQRRDDIDRALDGLQRRGPTYVFVARFTAFLRAVMPGLAGMSTMRYRSFFLANASSGILWGIAFSLLGYYAGSSLKSIENAASWIGYTIFILLVVVIVGIFFYRRRREQQRRKP